MTVHIEFDCSWQEGFITRMENDGLGVIGNCLN